MIDIWASDELKIATLGLIVLLFIALPLAQRKVAQELPPEHSSLYRKYASDTYVKTVLLLAPALVVAGRGYLNGNLSESITSSFLFICLSGGFGALWSAWRARGEIQAARKSSNNINRLRRLDNVTQMLKKVTVSAIVAVVLGACGLIYVQFANAQTSWFWFVAFILTLYPVTARAWSLAVLAVASRYAENPQLGEVWEKEEI